MSVMCELMSTEHRWIDKGENRIVARDTRNPAGNLRVCGHIYYVLLTGPSIGVTWLITLLGGGWQNRRWVLGRAHTKLKKRNRNRTKEKVKLLSTHSLTRQNSDICKMFQGSVLSTFSGQLHTINTSHGASREMKK